MALVAGTRLGQYEIAGVLGVGGMGEVYRATDTTLKRHVAIKVLPASVAGDVERMARFRREAELLAALNHPAIATIYSFDGLESSTRFLAMELVEGPTLADRIARGQIPLADALPIAKQIAEALEAAHEQGIVHRDLKPANIKIRDDGTVKVLDFGLAKVIEAVGAGETGRDIGSLSPTLTSPAFTQVGMILGTAAYMSPEQARGRAVDKRTDIWSFGCVLFEMLTGKRAFDGIDVTETIVAVVSGEPDWQKLPPDASVVRPLVARCLRKDRRARMRDIGDARLELDEVSSGTRLDSTSSTRSSTRSSPALALLTFIAGALIAAGALMNRPSIATPQRARFAIIPPAAQPLAVTSFCQDLALSGDGARIVYSGGHAAETQLMMRAVDQLEATPIPGTSGAVCPFVSADDQWIGFFTRGEIKKVPIAGGTPTSLAAVRSFPEGASWGSDGTIVFADGDQTAGLFSVPANGGEPKMLTKPDASIGEQDHLWPWVMPGGQTALFTVLKGPLGSSQIAAVDLKSGQRKTILVGGTHPQYVEPGYLVYMAVGSLRAVRFDPVKLEVRGEPVPVLDRVMTKDSGAGQFSTSRHGTLAYVPGSGGVLGGSRSLVWVDRDGREEPTHLPLRAYYYPRISPDGTRVALDARDQQSDIWIWEIARGTLTRLTDSPAVDSYPVWTPDSRRIIFSSARAGAQNLFWQPADKSGAAEQLSSSPNRQYPTTISPDSRFVLFKELSPQNRSDVLQAALVDVKGLVTDFRAVVQTSADDDNPDVYGHWLAYQSAESGQPEIYVRPFGGSSAGQWPISTGGGTRPLWARSGRELFYIDRTGRLMSVQVQTSPVFSAGRPTTLIKQPYFTAGTGRNYDVTPDGKRFLMIKDDMTAESQDAAIIVMLNWAEELKATLPK